MHNYYKILGKSTAFFFKSVVALGVSFVFNIVAYIAFGTMEAISVASILALLVWYVLSEWGLKKSCKSSVKPLLYIIVMCALFYLCACTSRYWIGGVAYLIAFAISCACFFGRDYKNIKNVVR
jgi:hypothetical protein